MSRLRPYQTDVKVKTYAAWHSGAKVVMPVVPTGGGKTVIVGEIVREMSVPTCAIAHRQELVSQISIALAREGIRHGVIAPPGVVRSIVSAHMAELNRSMYDPNAAVRVAGVDTLVRKESANDAWFRSVRLVVEDEGHHVLQANKWGAALRLFPDALGLLPTATPRRADGKGLGRHADGYVDVMVEGPHMRALIDAGYLTDYRVVCPPQAVNLDSVPVSDTTGDFNQTEVRRAVHSSPRLVGDVVREYLRWAAGKLGVTFAVDVESAKEIAAAYRAAGVPAEVVSAKTPDDLRRSILRRFKAREILQLVNVDLFGEGFDLPAIEVVSMARPTQSYALYAQQFGRALRLMISEILSGAWDTYTDDQRRAFIAASTKPKAIIIDHVGNVERHGLPDRRQEWSLDRRERRAKTADDAEALRACPNPGYEPIAGKEWADLWSAVERQDGWSFREWREAIHAAGLTVFTGIPCSQPYERFRRVCPYCGYYQPPAERSTLIAVDGDLTELDPARLAEMRGEIARIDGPCYPPQHLDAIAAAGARNQHHRRQQYQSALRTAVGVWAAVHADADDATNQRRFFRTFGVDLATAFAYGAKDADALRERVAAKITEMGYHLEPTT